MKSKCCRSLPRCASCPVLVAAAARRARDADGPAALVASILVGSGPPLLAPCVQDALARLDQARAAAHQAARPRVMSAS